MITVNGRVPNGVYINDLKLRIPFKVNVQITELQYNRSRDLHQAINNGSVRKLLGPANVIKTPQGRREDALQRENLQLRQEKAVLESRLRSEGSSIQDLEARIFQGNERVRALESKLDVMLQLLQNQHSVQMTSPNTTTQFSGTSVQTQAPVVDDTPTHYIPKMDVTETSSNIEVRAREGRSLTGSMDALKKLRGKTSKE